MCVCCLVTQAQHGAGLAAAVALLRPVSSQPGSAPTRSALPGDAAPRAARLRLSEAAAELAEVSRRRVVFLCGDDEMR